MKYEVITKSLSDTKKFASVIAKTLNPPYVIFLQGGLGAGKTTFTKFLLEGLGVKEVVTSPTFTIVNEYDGRCKIYHFDMYRLQDCQEAKQLGFEEMIFDNAISVIEWPEKVSGLIDSPDMLINIDIIGENERKFTVEYV